MPGVSLGGGVSLADFPSYSEIATNVGPLLPSALIPGEFTVNTLPTANVDMVDKYARVMDLFGEKRDLVLCSQIGSTYFWQPVRSTYAKSLSSNSNWTLTTLKTPTVLFLNGTLSANRTLTLDPLNAYPGATFEIALDGVLGLYSMTVVGLDLGGTLAIPLNARRRFFFDTSWKQF